MGLLLGLALIPTSWPANASDATSVHGSDPGSPRVLVLGDSISAAYGMSLEQGWAALLERQLKKRWDGSQVINASISGDTSAGGLRRLPDLLEEHRPDLVVIELGGNDGLRGYPTQKLEANLTEMAELAVEVGADVLLLPMEIPPNYGPRYTRSFRESFQRAASNTDSTLGPFLLDGIATEPALMQNDGIHPTVEAQPMITQILQPVIEELLGQRTPS
ncbi:arylesterase [Congregibacter brevis]|uniref:Arylesterase n=1 Tax=Congregibacter brevis TaxID=3081201 RepID=A0ABZ0IAE1_9GAMM|nr:arylesterase [Congregibacter sp. IMCC45268]